MVRAFSLQTTPWGRSEGKQVCLQELGMLLILGAEHNPLSVIFGKQRKPDEKLASPCRKLHVGIHIPHCHLPWAAEPFHPCCLHTHITIQSPADAVWLHQSAARRSQSQSGFSKDEQSPEKLPPALQGWKATRSISPLGGFAWIHGSPTSLLSN